MTKRMVSLLMALVLMVGIFAVPAMAAGAPDDGIELYGLVIRCPKCERDCYVSTRAVKTSQYIMVRCGSDGLKKHYLFNLQRSEDCSSCTYFKDLSLIHI